MMIIGDDCDIQSSVELGLAERGLGLTILLELRPHCATSHCWQSTSGRNLAIVIFCSSKE